MLPSTVPIQHRGLRPFAARGLLAFMLLVLLAACGGGGGVPNQNLTLTPATAAMQVGQNVVLTANLNGSPTSAVNWSSSDAAVAQVNAGMVTGVAPGTATVTATLASAPSVKATATITVTDPDGEPQGTVTGLAGGQTHSLAVRSDGSVWAWGTNLQGQLGVGLTPPASDVPLRVPLSGSYTAVAAGDHFSLALRLDGTVWAWGNNGFGQIGEDGGVGWQATPVQVVGVEGAIAIEATTSTAFALLDDGTVVAWGANTNGILGRGSFEPVSDPEPAAVAGLTQVTQLAAGGAVSGGHALALRSDGSVWAWGSNALGALGLNPVTAPPSSADAAAVPGLPADVVQVAAGSSFSLALLDDGSVRAWGAGGAGQLGDGEGDAFSYTPVTVSGLDDIVAVAAGMQHALALHEDGTVSAWGSDSFGQLGTGFGSGIRTEPLPVAAVQDIETVVAGTYHSLALDDAGKVWGWGWNLGLQVGLPAETEEQVFPVIVWE